MFHKSVQQTMREVKRIDFHATTFSEEKRVNVDELQATVKRVLTDPSFRNNARQVRAKLRTYGGALQTAALIEQFTQKGNAR
jgi:UDP:flavonoid glycosyltransferase YjiC (YdhE family)